MNAFSKHDLEKRGAGVPKNRAQSGKCSLMMIPGIVIALRGYADVPWYSSG
jgi:hypothetical protein